MTIWIKLKYGFTLANVVILLCDVPSSVFFIWNLFTLNNVNEWVWIMEELDEEQVVNVLMSLQDDGKNGKFDNVYFDMYNVSLV